MPYTRDKGLGQTKPAKLDTQLFLTVMQVEKILHAVTISNARHKRRDHAMIYLGLMLGLRCGEVVLLERKNLRNLGMGVVGIPTLKAQPRAPWTCPKCHRRRTVSATRIGEQFTCSSCGGVGKVSKPRGRKISDEPPEKSPPFVETDVIEYLEHYLTKMRDDQTWLFESRPGRHISTSMVRRIFGHWAMEANIDPIYSFHALRHGRGVMVWEATKDLEAVRSALRQKTATAALIYTRLSPKLREQYREQLETLAPNSTFQE